MDIDNYFNVVKNNDLIEFIKLTHDGYDILQANKLGQTALHLAMIHCDPAFIRYILEHTIDGNIDSRDKFGNTSLHYVVVLYGGVNIKQVAGFQLVSNLRSVIPDNDFDVRKTIIEQLVENGADINAQNKFGDTPLLDAAQYCPDDKIVKLLIKLGADTKIHNQNGDNYLTIKKWI